MIQLGINPNADLAAANAEWRARKAYADASQFTGSGYVGMPASSRLPGAGLAGFLGAIGASGCPGSCAGCARCPGPAGLSGLGFLPGFGWGGSTSSSSVPTEVRDAARNYLRFLADAADSAVSHLRARHESFVENILNEISSSQDYATSGWSEGRASKNEVLSTLRSALAEVQRNAPGWFEGWMGTPPLQVQAFVDAAQNVAIRMRARSASPDFDRPAVLSAEEQARVDGLEQSWAAKVEEDERIASPCSLPSLLTGETSLGDYWENCLDVPWQAKLAGAAALLFVGWRVKKAVLG